MGRRLIMLLIIGSIARSIMYLVFAVVGIAGYKVTTASPLCQVAGFTIMLGTEMNGAWLLLHICPRAALTRLISRNIKMVSI
jgi:hypothetical protein